MKKFITKLLSLVIASAVAIGTLAGCDLVTTNVDRDMAQVVAEISIDDRFDEKIYKRQMVSEYNSYGYSYEAYYGYSTAETYDKILTNLVENRIISQQSRLALASTTTSPGNDVSYFDQASTAVAGKPVDKLVKGATSVEDVTSIDHVLAGTLNEGKNHNGVLFSELELTKDTKVDEFLTVYEYEYSKYSILSTAKSLIDSYDEKVETEVKPYETFTVTDRATLTQPTTEEGNEWELKYDEEKSKVDENTKKSIAKIVKDTGITLIVNDTEIAFDVNAYSTKYDLTLNFYQAYNKAFDGFINSREGKSALIKIIRALKEAGLISEEEASKATPKTADELLSLTYFKDNLTTTFENQVIAKYKLALQNQLEKRIDEKTLYAEYKNLFNTQLADFESSSANYEKALSESGETTFVAYHPGTKDAYNGYGYVLNLLVGFNDMQKALLDAKKAENKITEGDVTSYRQSLAMGIVAKDQRASWIYSGYGDYDESTSKFTFKDTYVKTVGLREFRGEIKNAKSYDYLDSYGDAKKGYTYGSIKSSEMSILDLAQEISTVMGFNNNSNLYAQKTDVLDKTSLEIFRDYMYAYSTDPGSLSENYGYVYSPLTSSTQYVKEFAEAQKELVGKGAGEIKAVVTDYGMHIMLCSKVIKGTGNVALDEDAFINGFADEDSLAYNFKKYKLEVVVANEVSNIATSFIKGYKSKVTFHEDRYEDLVTEKE